MKKIGWAYAGVETVCIVLVLLFAPIVAIVAFATEDGRTGWAALGLFVCALVYGLVIAFELMRRRDREGSS